MIGRKLMWMTLIGVTVVAHSDAVAQNLLTNGGIEFEEDTFRHSIPPGWEMDEGPWVASLPGPYQGDYDDSGVLGACDRFMCYAVDAVDYTVWRNHFGQAFQLPNEVPGVSPGQVTIADYNRWKLLYGQPYTLSMAEPSNFHLLEGIWNMWFQPYNATFTEPEEDDGVFEAENNWAHLFQDVPGTPGTEYTMSGWALFENYFPGGVVNLNDGTGAIPGTAPFNDGPLSPTDSFFALEFLDVNGDVLPGSISDYELMANGQPVNPGGNAIWMEHTLVAVAPAGTVEVRVRASMINGALNPLPCNECFEQSFFVDDFSLTASVAGAGGLAGVPEPGTWLLSMIAMAIWSASTARTRERI
jgi:hypothetical protein